MHKGIRLAIIPRQEAETLHTVEEFDSPGRLFARQLTLWRGRTLLHWNNIANNLQVLGRYFSAAIDQVELKLLTFCQTFKPGALNSTDVDENIFAASFLLDEPKALLAVEELYRSLARSNDLSGHAVETAAATRATATATWAAPTAKSVTTAIIIRAAAAKAVLPKIITWWW